MGGSGEGSKEEKLGEMRGERDGRRQRLSQARGLGIGEPWLLLALFGHNF